jgi:hypothetical protein
LSNRIYYIHRTFNRLPEEVRFVLNHTNLEFDPIIHGSHIKTKEQILDWLRRKNLAEYNYCLASMDIDTRKRKLKRII